MTQPERVSQWNLPNAITSVRILLVPVFLTALFTFPEKADFNRWWAVALFVVTISTDGLDGAIARKRGLVTNLGKILDPIADKLLVAAALMMAVGMDRLSAASLYPAIVIMLREILVSGLREYLAGVKVGLPVTGLAKWKTGFQMGALGALLGGDTAAPLIYLSWLPVALIGEVMLWVAAVLTLATGWDYLTAGLRHASAPAGAVGHK